MITLLKCYTLGKLAGWRSKSKFITTGKRTIKIQNETWYWKPKNLAMADKC